MPGDDYVARINHAADECLGRCFRSSTPPELTLTGFCRELEEERLWSKPDVELVRTIVSKALAQRAG
jgi:hypothetical protein